MDPPTLADRLASSRAHAQARHTLSRLRYLPISDLLTSFLFFLECAFLVLTLAESIQLQDISRMAPDRGSASLENERAGHGEEVDGHALGRSTTGARRYLAEQADQPQNFTLRGVLWAWRLVL